MKLDSIRIVLVATTHPGNIGAAARALKTMGLERLYLVTPKTFPDQRAHEMAAGADDILANVVITNSLEEAIQDCHLVFATSARPRDIALPGHTPASMASFVSKQPEGSQIAVVFGREHAGLTNHELLRCHFHINIPSNSEYSSLNLAQAVQIIAYELRMKCLEPTAIVGTVKNTLAKAAEVEQFYAQLQSMLIAIDFLKLNNPKRLMQRLRRMFSRILLERMEVNILRGVLTHIEAALKKAGFKDTTQGKVKTDFEGNLD
jgi:tRNA (cytidine32/uridine32-2'-O)-methyltransferase